MGELRSNAATVIARLTSEIPPRANKAETQAVTAGISETGPNSQATGQRSKLMNKNHRSSRQARSERTSNRGQNSRTKPPVDSYFVCGTPRTGSSLLLGLLESTGVAGRPQAYFREPDEPLWADRWQVPRSADGGFDYADSVRAALAAGRTGNGVFGAKLM